MFSVPNTTITVLEGEHSLPIVILSIIIACAASYTALFLNVRVKHNLLFNKYFWLLFASIAMGLGIWSMHFIGMSAFMLPIPMTYDVFLTIVSIVPAVVASYIAFYFANMENKTQWASVLSGVVMGLGISAMHYIGMAAMKMEANYYYKPLLFLVSIIIAIVVSYVAIFIFSKLRNGSILIRGLVSILMGLAISSMHYVGMFAIVFYQEGESQHHMHEMHVMDMTLLIVIITIGIFLLFILAGLTSILGRYADYRLNYFDAITSLPNQRQFELDLDKIKVASSVGVLHLENLEKWIVAYGYSFGDKVIKSLSDSILALKTTSTYVYRIEGNRFAIISTDYQQGELMEDKILKLLSKLKKPVIIDDYRIKLGAVCAFTHAKKGKTNVTELFTSSMSVLKHPTIQYNHEIVEFDPSIHTSSLESQIVADIDQALENDDLFLVYQPKVDSLTMEVSGLEALLRWDHPTNGMISPGLFIPVLEEKGKIFDVTDWVIRKVCEQIADFLYKDVPLSHISINIPGSYVTSPRLLGVLKENLETYNVDSRYIELEITETSVIHDIDHAITAIRKFLDMGISVALDDFGTGLSSLSYLKTMPISTVKIDKSFVDGVPVSEKDSAVLTAIIKLCYSLNLKVVIEGVETKEQFDFINSLGFSEVPQIQGYYFSRPLKVEELKIWMNER